MHKKSFKFHVTLRCKDHWNFIAIHLHQCLQNNIPPSFVYPTRTCKFHAFILLMFCIFLLFLLQSRSAAVWSHNATLQSSLHRHETRKRFSLLFLKLFIYRIVYFSQTIIDRCMMSLVAEYRVDPTDLNLSGLEAFSFDYIVRWPVSLVLNRKVGHRYDPLTLTWVWPPNSPWPQRHNFLVLLSLKYGVMLFELLNVIECL